MPRLRRLPDSCESPLLDLPPLPKKPEWIWACALIRQFRGQQPWWKVSPPCSHVRAASAHPGDWRVKLLLGMLRLPVCRTSLGCLVAGLQVSLTWAELPAGCAGLLLLLVVAVLAVSARSCLPRLCSMGPCPGHICVHIFLRGRLSSWTRLLVCWCPRLVLGSRCRLSGFAVVSFVLAVGTRVCGVVWMCLGGCLCCWLAGCCLPLLVTGVWPPRCGCLWVCGVVWCCLGCCRCTPWPLLFLPHVADHGCFRPSWYPPPFSSDPGRPRRPLVCHLSRWWRWRDTCGARCEPRVADSHGFAFLGRLQCCTGG